VGGSGFHAPEVQAERIAAVRAAGDRAGVPIFVNARTDLFLQEPDAGRHASLVDEAIARAGAYAEAGADGFFVPGLLDPALIERVCGAVRLPVNVMTGPGAPANAALARVGVARISYGPHAYLAAMRSVGEAALAA
jgi:2-methylisocitrate lyase-like PEP mutase family enzyme